MDRPEPQEKADLKGYVTLEYQTHHRRINTALKRKGHDVTQKKVRLLMERMFGDFTRDHKRKTGTDSAGRTILAMVDDTPLIRNLKNENYRKIIIGDKNSLAEVFAEIDIHEVRKKMKEQNVCDDRIPAKIQSLLKKDKLLDMLSNIGAKFGETRKI